MTTANDQAQPSPAELRKKFGEEADTYAEVRAEAAAAAGRHESSDTWDELASALRDQEATESEGDTGGST
jgi:hypothetical protein